MGWKVQKRRKGRYRRFHNASQGISTEGWSKLHGGKRTIIGPRYDARHNRKASLVHPVTPSDIDKVADANKAEVFLDFYQGMKALDPRGRVLVRLARTIVYGVKNPDFNFIYFVDLPSVTVRLFFSGSEYVWVREYIGKSIQKSIIYPSREAALEAYYNEPKATIRWLRRIELPP